MNIKKENDTKDKIDGVDFNYKKEYGIVVLDKKKLIRIKIKRFLGKIISFFLGTERYEAESTVSMLNANFIEKYVDVNGKVTIRSIVSRFRMLFFASFKFFTDRILALIGLLLLSPILIIISIAIKIDSRGPILFKQERTGKHGKVFYLYKFRTMVANNDVHDFSKEDEHTKVGTFLRKTSLDELPQLINILLGQMSFIGPRPWIHDYYENMTEIQRFRYVVRPGITGLAQANGRNSITIFDKIKYDLEYIENYSLRQDIIVILLTIVSVLSTKGADAGKQTIQEEIDALKEYKNRIQ